MKRALLAFTLMLLLLVVHFRALPLQQDDGVVSVSPAAGVAGHFGTWTVTYRVGAAGIAEGGGVRVQLPDTWHAGDRNSANPLQATNPRGDHYITARASRPEIKVEAVVEGESG